MIDILTDTAATGENIKRYIQRHIVAYGYCSVDEVAQLSGVRAVQVSEIGWPLHRNRIGWLKMPEIAFCKDSEEDFWKIQIDDPVRLDSFNTFKTECQNRPFFVKSPNGTWEPINERIEPLIDTYPYVGRKNGKTYLDSIACDGFRGGKIYDVKTIHKEDKNVWDISSVWENYVALREAEERRRMETHFTPKSIERSADHRTVVVVWNDKEKTIVRLSPNDPDDIYMAFTAALAKRIFGTNSHIKKVIGRNLNEHKPKVKRLPSDPDPKEIPIELEYAVEAKKLFLESHLIYDVRITINLMDTGEIRVHMYNPLKGSIKYIKNVESTQDALREIESMWQEFNTEKEE